MSEENQDLETLSDSSSQDSLSDWPAPGIKLKAIREELGLSHARVAESLHITAHYVKALEDAQYEKLPGKTFVKGYFKAYAKFLGTDVDEIMMCYDQHVAALEETVKSEASVIRAKKAYDQNLRWMICAAVIIILVIGLSWWFSREDNVATDNSASDNTLVAGTELKQDDVVLSAGTQANQPLTAEVLVASMAQENKQTDREPEAQSPMSVAQSPGLEDTGMALMNESASNVREIEQKPDESDVEVVADLDSTGSNESVIVLPQASETNNELSLTFGEDLRLDGEAQSIAPPDYLVTLVENHRNIELDIEGDDLLEFHLLGDSWIQVDDGESTRLYHDMLKTGDDLTIKATAPFNILIGDASVVKVTFNLSEVDVMSRKRSDNSARILLQRENR